MTPEQIATEKAALDKRKQEQDAREATFAEDAQKRRADDNAAFAEELINEGRLLPASKDQVVSVLNALPVDQDVSFADGDSATKTATVTDALKAIFKAQPVVVNFGGGDLGGDPHKASAVYFAADGKPIDTDQLALDQKAKAYMGQHPGTDYINAVQAVS